MKKALDQTVREFKREVNKVLKVPEIEQKVLAATSNEPWGPHGSAMADIAHATRNYSDYQLIMAVIWKRINDTGRNWRHVYKALTLLEFLVAHGSERVIDELKEHAYQLSTLVDFQYIDSRGKDQGQNVRRKSQNLVSLLNDKEKIREVRQKAVENRDKYRGLSSTGGMYKPSSYNSTGGSYGGDRYEEDSYGSNSRYGGRDDDRYGRDRDGDRYRDDDRYGRDWDRNGRDSSRGGVRYRDDYDHEDDRYSSRKGDERQSENYKNFEKDRDRAYDDDDRLPSRNGGGRGDDYGHDDRRPERKFSDARPPSYEEALGSPDYRASEEQRDGGGLAAAVARASSRSNLSELDSAPKAPSASSQVDDFDEFDPRASSVTAAAAAAPPAHADLTFGQAEPIGALLALPPPLASLSSNLSTSSSDLFGDSGTSGFTPAPAVVNSNPLQQFDSGLFGDSPFKVETASSVPTNLPPSFTAPAPANAPPPSYMASAPANPPPSFSAYPTGDGGVSAVGMGTHNFNPYAAAPPSQAAPVSFGGDAFFGNDSLTAAFGAPSNGAPPAASPFNPAMAPQQVAPSAFQANQAPAAPSATLQPTYSATLQPTYSSGSATLQPTYSGTLQPTYSGTLQPTYSGGSATLQPTYSGGSATLQPTYSGVSQAQKGSAYPKPQPDKKFETKSTVWTETLNKGLIDLNIAGPKSNPLAGIGIDFDLLRTERIKEEKTASKSTSTVNMGKAMGSGSGLGLAGAGAILPPTAPVMMNTMGMGMTPPMGMGMRPGMGPAMGMGGPMMQMGMNPGMPMRPNMGMGPGMGMGMGMGMGTGMGTYPNQQQQYSGYR